MHAAHFLIRGLNVEMPEKFKRYIERSINVTCAITGDAITEGIKWRRVIPASTGEYLDLLHGAVSEYISIEAATAFASSWNLGSRLIFENGDAYHPLVSLASAKKSGRACWSNIIREIWPQRRGQRCLIIVAGDFRKRVWPLATIGSLGARTAVFLLDPKRHIACNLFVDWARLVQTLDLVEEVYATGFNKDTIADGLFTQFQLFEKMPVAALEYEEKLEQYRSTAEFNVALLTAQKRN